MRTGFTMIELTAVILILAIMAGAVTIKLSSPLAEARFQDVLIEVDSFLAFARDSAVRTGRPVEVVLDIDGNALVQEPMDEAGYERQRRLEFPEAFRLHRVVMRESDVSSGFATIRYTAKGLTGSYAVMLGDRDRPRVLLISGLGGQITVCDDATEAQHIFESLAASG